MKQSTDLSTLSIITIVSVIVLAGLFASYMYFQSEFTDDAPAQTPSVREELIEEETNEYVISLEYPRIENLSNPVIQSTFNETFKPDIDTIRTELLHSREVGMLPDTTPVAIQTQRFVPRFISHDLLSISFEHHWFNGSSAHGGLKSEVANYDLTSGEEILLDDLFKPDTDYKQIISDHCVSVLTERLQDKEWIMQGAEPAEENLKNFVITENGLIIIFDPYQVASFADGFQEVHIPYSVIEDSIDPNGPLRVFTGS